MIEVKLATGETVPLGTIFQTMFVIAQMRDHTSLIKKIVGVEEAPTSKFSKEEIALLRKHNLIVAIVDDEVVDEKIRFHRDVTETLSAMVRVENEDISFVCPSADEDVEAAFKRIFSNE